MLYNSTTTLYRNLITLIYYIKQLLGAVDGQRSFTWERKTNYYNTISDIYIQKTNFLSFLGFPVSYIMTKINGVIQYKHPFWDLVISFPNNIPLAQLAKHYLLYCLLVPELTMTICSPNLMISCLNQYAQPLTVARLFA